MDRRRYIGRKKFAKVFSSKIIRVDEEDLKGYASFLKIEEVHDPIFASDFCICDNGYSMLEFLPDGEHWVLEAIYDENGDIVEWYFDMTSKNAVDEENNPYNDDLYLDAVLLPDGRVLILDEDELKDALDDRTITQSEFDLAYETLSELQEKKIIDVAYMTTFCSRLRSLFE